MGKLKRLLKPPIFQGTLKEKEYFEGWYLKNVSRDLSSVISFIPGISLSKRSHTFIQVINGITGWTEYFEFEKEQFHPSDHEFSVDIAGNEFSYNGLKVDLEKGDTRIRGELRFSEPSLFPKGFLSPGIMGWYTFVPRMECYHGVVSMNHGLEGCLDLNGRSMIFDGGKGYIEKDWGRSFPESWIWLQCNNFKDPTISMMLSIAKIPWMGKHFTGFLSFLRKGDKVHRFTTYTGAKITGILFDGEELRVRLEDKKFRLDISATHKNPGELAAPVLGNMDRRIKESVDSDVHIQLKEKKGNELISSFGTRAGLEIMADVEQFRLPPLPHARSDG